MARDSHDILVEPPPPPADERLAYGAEPLQFGDLRVPRGDGPWPLALVVHGGYWKATYNLIHTGHMCVALCDAGIATFNVEYRRVGDAGGDLVLWAAKRARLPVVALAPVSDLRESYRRVGGDGAAAAFLGGAPDEVPERYAEASPIDLLPLGVRQLLVHGTADESVPYGMSEAYTAAAAGEAELITLEGAGHFELIDPQTSEWT